MPLSKLNILVTSGPTIEKIDPVRYLSNYSSGKQGHAIAAACAEAGANVTLISGPVHIPDPQGVNVVHVESAQHMHEACHNALPADVAICSAAVCDWQASTIADDKLKKRANDDELTLHFTKTPDILKSLGTHPTLRPKLVVGFAAETENFIQNARIKLFAKQCDWVLVNDVSNNKVFGQEDTHLQLVTHDSVENLEKRSKEEVAKIVVFKMHRFFTSSGAAPIAI